MVTLRTATFLVPVVAWWFAMAAPANAAAAESASAAASSDLHVLISSYSSKLGREDCEKEGAGGGGTPRYLSTLEDIGRG